MDIVWFIVGVLIVAIGVAISIGLHELGHLYFAKKFGVRVTRYMIGFGPKIWSKKGKETEYGVKALPLGGYIQMIGMYPPSKGEDESKARSGSSSFFQGIISQARQQNDKQITEEDQDRVFYKLSTYKKIIIMFAGPAMNLVLAFLLFVVLIVFIGKAVPTPEIDTVYKCVQVQDSSHAQNSKPKTQCSDSDKPSPAQAAGLKPGDRLVSVDGKKISSWEDSTEIIRTKAGQPIEIVYERNGKDHTSKITPIKTQKVVTDETGKSKKDSSGKYITEEVGFVGLTSKTKLEQQSIMEVFPTMGEHIGRTAVTIINLPQRVFDAGKAAFSDEKRDPEGPVSIVGVGRMAGEVSAMDDVGLESKASILIGLLAGLNLALFVFNLVPLMPLDGGHIAGAAYEGAKRGVYKLRRKQDPGYVDIAKMLPLTYIVALTLIVITALLVYADVVKPITLRQ